MATLSFHRFNEDSEGPHAFTPEEDAQFVRTETLRGVRITEIDIALITVDGRSKLALTVAVDPATVPELPPRWSLDIRNRLVRDSRDAAQIRYRNTDVTFNDPEMDDAITTTPEALSFVAEKPSYSNPHLILVECLDRNKLLRMTNRRTLGDMLRVALYEEYRSPNVHNTADINRAVTGGSLSAFKSALGVNKAARLYSKWREEIALETGELKPVFKHVPGKRLVEFDEPPAPKKFDKRDSWKDSVQVSAMILAGRRYVGDSTGLEVGQINNSTVFLLGLDRTGARPCYTDRPRWPRALGVSNPLMGDTVTDRQPDCLIFWPSIAGWHGIFCLHMRQSYKSYSQHIFRKYLIPIFADGDDMDKGAHPLALRGLSKTIADQIGKMPGGPSALAYFLAELPRELAKAKGPIGDEDYGLETPPNGHLIRQATGSNSSAALCDSSYYTSSSRKSLCLWTLVDRCTHAGKDILTGVGYWQTKDRDPRHVWTARHSPDSLFLEPVPGAPQQAPAAVQPVARVRCLEI